MWLLALVALPKFLYHFLIYKKYHTSFLKRAGLNFSFPKLKKPVIWIHAVSLGETKAIVPLASQLKLAFPNYSLIISSITETGHEEAKKSISCADYHLYLPFDFSFLTKRVVSHFSPSLVLLSESDFWFNFLRHAKKAGAKIALVNGKLSSKSAKRFQQISFFSKELFDLFDLFCLQNQEYYQRFEELSIDCQRLSITGNLKFDCKQEHLLIKELEQWRKKLCLDGFILTIGSTHPLEEELFIPILQKLWKVWPNLKVLLIPRHLQRAQEVAKLFSAQSIHCLSYKSFDKQQTEKKKKAQVILLDIMGLLPIAYQLADLCIVGGSYTSKVGGHNILEPCEYGKPVIFGPYMHSQKELVTLVTQSEGGWQIEISKLYNKIVELLKNTPKRLQAGQKGKEMRQNLSGSTEKTIALLKPLLKK